MNAPPALSADIAKAIREELLSTDWTSIAKKAYNKVKAVTIAFIALIVVGFLVLLAFLIAILVLVVQIDNKV